MMKQIKTAVCMLLLGCGIFTAAHAGDIVADSRITAVTVYPGSAKVTRSSTLTLQAGDNRVVIDNLPLNIIETSLRVDGEGQGDISLGSVQLKKNILRDVVQEKEKALLEQIEQAEQERRVLGDEVNRYQSQLEYIRQMVMGGNRGSGSDENVGSYARLPLEQWQQAWQTLDAATADMQQKIRQSEKALNEVDKTLNKLRRDLNQVATNQKETLSATLQVQSSTSTDLALRLTYQINGARWEPVYDADLDTAKGEIHLKTLAQISQRTGEDWADVSVTLSTLRPGVNSQLPELDSWVLDFMPPPQPMPAPMVEESLEMAVGGLADDMQNIDRRERFARKPMPKKRIRQQQSRLISTDFSAEYQVPGKISLDTGSDKRRFTLSAQALQATVKLASAPRFDPRVMIQTETSYTRDTPLIAGSMSLYRNGSFVGNTFLGEKLSGEEIKLSFGEDSKVKINFQPDPDQKRKDGLFSKQKVIERHYKVSITSNHDKPYAINIYDVMPVAAHEDIEVKTLGQKPTQRGVDDKKGVVRWEKKLPPKKEQSLTYGYSVSYPEDQVIQGL